MSVNKIVRSVFIIIIFAILSRITGFMRETVIAAYFGIGVEADAYFFAQTIPYAFISISEACLGVVILPMYIQYSVYEGDEYADRFASNLINIMSVGALILSAASIIISPYIMRFFASGFAAEVLDLSISLMSIFFCIPFFTVLSNLSSGILQSKERFLIPSFVSIPANIFIICSVMMCSREYGILSAAWAGVAGAAFQVIIQIFALRGSMRYTFIFSLKEHRLKDFCYMLFPVAAGMAMIEINNLVGRTVASRLGTGGVATMNYSTLLVNVIAGVFAMAVTAAIYPLLSTLSAKRDYSEFRNLISRAVIVIAAIVIPATIGIMALKEDLVKIVFQRGAFDSSATLLTSSALGFYIVGLIGYSLRELFLRAFYSIGDTATPNIILSICFLLSIVLSIVLTKYMGLEGLGLTASIVGIASSMVLILKLQQTIGVLDYRSLFFGIAKILVSSAVMGIVIYILKMLSFCRETVVIIAVLSMIPYIVLLYCFKLRELHAGIEILRGILSFNNIRK